MTDRERLAAAWDEAVAWFALRSPLNDSERISERILLEAEESNPYRIEEAK